MLNKNKMKTKNQVLKIFFILACDESFKKYQLKRQRQHPCNTEG